MDKNEIVHDENNQEAILEIIQTDYTYFIIKLFNQILDCCDEENMLLFDQCDIRDFASFVYSVSTGPPTRLEPL